MWASPKFQAAAATSMTAMNAIIRAAVLGIVMAIIALHITMTTTAIAPVTTSTIPANVAIVPIAIGAAAKIVA